MNKVTCIKIVNLYFCEVCEVILNLELYEVKNSMNLEICEVFKIFAKFRLWISSNDFVFVEKLKKKEFMARFMKLSI